jgi:hypothetical protein
LADTVRIKYRDRNGTEGNAEAKEKLRDSTGISPKKFRSKLFYIVCKITEVELSVEVTVDKGSYTKAPEVPVPYKTKSEDSDTVKFMEFSVNIS